MTRQLTGTYHRDSFNKFLKVVLETLRYVFPCPCSQFPVLCSLPFPFLFLSLPLLSCPVLPSSLRLQLCCGRELHRAHTFSWFIVPAQTPNAFCVVSVLLCCSCWHLACFLCFLAGPLLVFCFFLLGPLFKFSDHGYGERVQPDRQVLLPARSLTSGAGTATCAVGSTAS